MVREILILEDRDLNFYPVDQSFIITDPIMFQKRVYCALDEHEIKSSLLQKHHLQQGFRITCLSINKSGKAVFEMTHGAVWHDIQIITDVNKEEWPQDIGLKAVSTPHPRLGR